MGPADTASSDVRIPDYKKNGNGYPNDRAPPFEAKSSPIKKKESIVMDQQA